MEFFTRSGTSVCCDFATEIRILIANYPGMESS